MPYTYRTRVRYGECDQQGVVFNPNYMVYMDDASENWASSLVPSGNFLDLDWDWMVVKTVIEWQSPARHGDILEIAVAVVRYGSTSLDFGFIGSVDGRAVFSARNICVSVGVGTHTMVPTPYHVKALLGPAEDWATPG